jgi:hypothetical protein
MADQHIPDNDDELDPFEEFLGGIEGDEGGLFDPTQVVFIRSTGGANVEVGGRRLRAARSRGRPRRHCHRSGHRQGRVVAIPAGLPAPLPAGRNFFGRRQLWPSK